ncbi:MAG: hypothetical protein PF638_04480 [Candidatus Delongbacteria bacterium]|jgi:predicted ATPase|nr:hypothetical protein [Candidatus Delongbacteria bacterium]
MPFLKQISIKPHSESIFPFTLLINQNFNEDVVEEIDYEDVEHVTLTKSFLNDPENFLRRL